jgi:glyoxylase I family protein
MFTRIDHVEIVPRDIEKTIAFYTDVLEFTIKRRQKVEALRKWGTYTVEEVVYLVLGDTMIELIKVSEPSSTVHDPWGVGYRMIALAVEDMDRAVEYLTSKGVEITAGPVTLGPSKRAEIKDPDGLPIELRQW